MDPVEKLIEYYFHRKRAGMSDEDISSSLSRQPLIDEEQQALILRAVQLREEVYQQEVQRQKVTRYIMLAGVVALATALFFSFEILSSSPILVRSLAALGIIVLLGGFVAGKMNSSRGTL